MAQEKGPKGATEPVNHLDLRKFPPERVKRMLEQAVELWREKIEASGSPCPPPQKGLHQLIQDLVRLRLTRKMAKMKGEEAQEAQKMLKEDDNWRF